MSKVCQEQCLSSDLHTCLFRPPQPMNGLPSNSTGSSSSLLHLRRREVAFRSPRNTSAGAYVKADNDCCIRPMMKSGWRLKKIGQRAVVVYPSIDESKHSPLPFPMTPRLSRESNCKQGRLFVRAGLPV